MQVANSWAWRIPSLLQGAFPLKTVSLVFFMPESPRFLASKGRNKEAHKVLATYHANKEFNDPLVLQELMQIQNGLSHDKESIKWTNILATKQNEDFYCRDNDPRYALGWSRNSDLLLLADFDLDRHHKHPPAVSEKNSLECHSFHSC